jgi:hypothetical protein
VTTAGPLRHPEPNHPLTALRRLATVYDLGDFQTYITVSISPINGDLSTDLHRVSYTTNYRPRINDVVVLLENQGDYVAIGSVTTSSATCETTDPCGQPWGYARLENTTDVVVPDGSWIEVNDFQLSGSNPGGDPIAGQVSPAANGIIVPAPGFYNLVARVTWPPPPAPFGRTLVAIDVAGLGPVGSTALQRSDIGMDITSSLRQPTPTIPLECAIGQKYAVYVWQNCGSTVTISATAVKVTCWRES